MARLAPWRARPKQGETSCRTWHAARCSPLQRSTRC
uniref:Uncharacterized protein n=1 Tax=Arundo donax TaxID=35708 RepID=A0A0A8Y5X4_ARUDO